MTPTATGTDARRDGAFAALRDRPFRLWFLAQTFSGAGTVAQAVGAAWLILQLTNSGFALGLLSVATFGPIALTGVWAGAFVDRFDCRRTLIVTQGLSMGLALLLATLSALGDIRVWLIFAITTVTGFVFTLDQPARQLYVLELVGAERVQSATGLFEVILNASRVLGPGAAGLMLAFVGVSACFFANAVSFLPPLVVLLMLRPRSDRPPSLRAGSSSVREGIRYVRGIPVIKACLLIAGSAGMLFNLSAVLPLYANRVLGVGGAGYGALMACFGLGAIPGGFAAARTSDEDRDRRIRILCFATAASVVAFAVAPSPYVAYPLIFVVGLFSIWLIAMANALVQLRAEPAIRGRVLGLWTMVLPGLNPLTGFAIGAAAELLGARVGMSISGCALLVAGVVGWRTLGQAAAPIGARVEAAS